MNERTRQLAAQLHRQALLDCDENGLIPWTPEQFGACLSDASDGLLRVTPREMCQACSALEAGGVIRVGAGGEAFVTLSDDRHALARWRALVREQGDAFRVGYSDPDAHGAIGEIAADLLALERALEIGGAGLDKLVVEGGRRAGGPA